MTTIDHRADDTITDELLACFPRSFLWGAATAAYQIEGGVDQGGRGPSIWDTFAHQPGRIENGDTGDVACNHFELWEHDVELMSTLGLNAYRLSLSWSRLQPLGVGPLNSEGVSFYRRLLEALRTAGVRPFVTLYHWDLPQALEDRGGWPERDTALLFAEYVSRVIAALGDLADDWITLNEPWCAAFIGYWEGRHAPGRQDLPAAVAAGHHLNVAHGLATQAIRAQRPNLSVGASNLITDLIPASDSQQDHAATVRMDLNNNQFFLAPVLTGAYPDAMFDLYREQGLEALVQPGDEVLIGQPTDFVGINHYQQIVVSHDPTDPHLHASGSPAEPATTSLGWSVRPESLSRVLLRVAHDYTSLPLYVTENGACFDDHIDPLGRVMDLERVSYLSRYIAATAHAIGEGVNVQGYFAWSLLDNFEWAEGFGKRFGLVHVDFATQRRIPKESARWYRETIGQHARAVG